MKTKSFIKFLRQSLFLIAGIFYLTIASAQYMELKQLNGFEAKIYYSAGHQQRAKDIATQTKNAIDYHSKLLGFKPEVTLLVLSPEDWSKHTSFPVYGMPHYKNDQTLVVASSDNSFWKSFIPQLDKLPETVAEKVRKTYRTDDGKLSMQPFFDLLALHELGHAFHIQGGLKMQRKWMGEFFSNMFLHTYIAEKEPSLLPALTVFPEMVVSTGTTGFTYTSLKEFEDHYTALGKQHPRNYGWYQSRFHAAAKDIYNAGGSEMLVKLWRALKENKVNLMDNEFAAYLQKEVNPVVANVMLDW
ncbi:MAG: hypothetical protein ACR2KB_10900 [Chitinophagaceae bacterium]